MSLVWVNSDKIGRSATATHDEAGKDLGVVVETPWTSDPIDLARERNDRRNARSDKPPEGELGSAFDRYRIYAYYENGNIFEQGPIETADLEDMISKDGIGRALEQVLTLPMRSIDWSIKPGPGDKGEAAFVTQVLTTPAEMGGMEIPMETVIGQMTSAVLYKRAHFEKIFRVQDGQVGYQKIAFRPPTTCYLARAAKDASFQGFMQWTWAGLKFIKVVIPANKAFVFLHGAHRNPLEGITDLDVAYNAWQSKQKLRFLWFQFMETQATPGKVATDNTVNPTHVGEFAATVAKMRGAATVGLEQGQTVSVIESNGQGATQFQAAMGYLDQEMLQSCLAGFLGLTAQATGHAGGGARGSNALSQGQTQFYLQSRQGVLKEMAAAIRWGLIRDLVTYNFGVGASCPTFQFGDLAQADAADKALGLLQSMLSAATPTTLAPWGFIDELILKATSLLNMDVDVVAAAILGQAHKASDTPADTLSAQMAGAGTSAPLHQAIANAHALVASHMGAQPNGSNGKHPAGAAAADGGYQPPA